MRDGRLQSRGMTTVLECTRCGRFIAEGKYCDSCLNDLNSQIKQVLPGKSSPAADKSNPKGSRGDRMYTKEDK